MRPLRILLAVAVGVLTTLVLAVPPSFACSCVSGDPADFTARADTVLVGLVTRVQAAKGRSSLAPVVYTLAVDRVLKGSTGPEVEVRSPASSASCGLEGVVAGRRYVVFAGHRTVEGRPADRLWANMCGGTAPASPRYVAAVEKVTGPGTAVEATPSPSPPAAAVDRPTGAGPDPDERFPVAATVAGAGAVAVVAAAALLLLRRRRAA